MKKITKLFFAALALLASSNVVAQDDPSPVVYTSCGYDVNNQKMVNFTWSAEEGFLSVAAPEGQNLSAVAYKKGSNLYTLTGSGQQQTLTVMDCETFEQKSQVSGTLNAVCGMPISVFACDQAPLASFAIASAKEEGVGVRYYTAVVDEQTAEVKRISTIGYWYDDASKTSIAPITFFFSYGSGYVVYAKRQGGTTKAMLGRLDVMTGVITETGAISLIENLDPTKAVASIYYLSTTYRNYLVISPDGEQNSTIYYLPTFATNGEVACTEETKADCVLASCYQRPSTVTTYGNPTTPIAQPEDLNLDVDGTKITLTFTMPSTDIDGNALTPDDWAVNNDYSRSINVNVYMESSTVTMTKPEGVNYFFPGDKVTLTGDLSAVYGVTNPNGLHCFTVRVQPSNGYTGKALRDTGIFALVGGAKPEPVTAAKAEKSGNNSGLFSWTAPTATEYSDWGYEFDGSNLTYTIVRNVDGVVLAEGITGTSAEVDNLAKEPGDYDFSIYAAASGTQSAAAVTNAIYCQPPTYDYLGYNNTTGSIIAFNTDEQFTHTDWMTNTNIGNEVGFVRGSKVYTTKYSYSKTQWSEYASQQLTIFTAEKFEQQGYATSNYWYPNNGQIIRHLTTAAFSPELDRAFGVAVDTVRNADAEAVELKYYVIDVDTVASYTLQNRIVDVLGRWSLVDEMKDAKAVMAMTSFKGTVYAAVACRQKGVISYELCTFNPMTQELTTIAPIALDIDLSYGTQFFLSTTDKLYLGYNNGEDNTVLYEISVADAQLTKIFDMDGQYTYAYQKPSTVVLPAQTLAAITPAITIDELTGKVSVSVAVPANDVNGNTIDAAASLKVSVLQDGKEIGSATGNPGNTVEMSDIAVSDGLHLLTIVVSSPDNSVIGAVRVASNVIVGPAKPSGPTNVEAESFGDFEANITWKAPTTSVWADFGATIKEGEVLTYIVELNQTGEQLASDLVDPEFYAENFADADGFFDFVVYAVNGMQKSEGVVSNLIGAGTVTAISSPAISKALGAEAIYNEAGQLQQRLQRGLNIVRRADGKTVKVIVK